MNASKQIMSGHGNAVRQEDSHEHEAANDSHYGHKPKLAHLEDKIEDIEKAFEKDLEKYAEHNTKDNHMDIMNMAGDSHDVAYTAFKKKFEELANDHHEPLAERGKDISDKHLNDLLESYISDFLIHNQGEHGKAKVEAYKSEKFDGENKESQRMGSIQRLFMQAGFNLEDKENSSFYHMANLLKKNKSRHTSVVNDLSGNVKNEIAKYHVNQNFVSTIGKSKYDQNHKLALKALNHFGKKVVGFEGYDIEHDDDHKSKFYKMGISNVRMMIDEMHLQGKYNVDKDHLEQLGLKYKNPHAEHEGAHH